MLVERLINEKEAQGYKRVNLEIDASKAAILAVAYSIPVCIPFVIIFLMRNSIHLNMIERIAGLVALIALVVVHELIHGITWGCLAKKHFKSVEFGYVKEACMPYCTCTEPLTKGQYFAGGIMPCLVLGIIPMVVSIFTGSFVTLVIGVVMTLGAGGDLAVLMKMLTYKTDKKDITFMDHPTGVGMFILEK